MSRAPHRQPHELDASFRVLTHYDVMTDSIFTRLDVRLPYPAMQFHVELSTSKPGHSDLIVPTRGVDGGMAFKAASADLVAAFRGLADKIEQQAANSLHVEVQRHPEHLAAYMPPKPPEEPKPDVDHIWRAIRAAAGG